MIYTYKGLLQETSKTILKTLLIKLGVQNVDVYTTSGSVIFVK